MYDNDQPRQPDFADPESHTLVWIGDDGAVEIPWDQSHKVERLYENAGWYARVGMLPQALGITVERFAPDFIHPGTGFAEVKGETDFHHTLWRVFTDTLEANGQEAWSLEAL